MDVGLRRRDHAEAEEKYAIFRQLAYESAMEEFPGVNIRGITYSDAVKADTWKSLCAGGDRLARGSWRWT